MVYLWLKGNRIAQENYVEKRHQTTDLSGDIGVMKAEFSEAVDSNHEEETRQLNKRDPVREVRPTGNRSNIAAN